MKPRAALFVFLAVLAPLEARAFFEPVNQIIAPVPAENAFYHYDLGEEARALAMPKWPAGQFFMIKDKHYKAASEVKAETFKERYFKYAREVWGPETKDLTDEALMERIESAIRDAKKMGPARESDVTKIALIYLLWPDVMADEKVWKKVYEGDGVNPIANPYQRAGRFLLKAVARNVPDQKTADEIWQKLIKFKTEGY